MIYIYIYVYIYVHIYIYVPVGGEKGEGGCEELENTMCVNLCVKRLCVIRLRVISHSLVHILVGTSVCEELEILCV